VSKADYVVVTEPVRARFMAPSTAGQAPFVVAFANQSLGGSEYTWDFGDGAKSGESNPTHLYAFGGEYTVTLWARAPDGSGDFLQRVKYVQVDGDLEADFTATRTYGPAPLEVQFSDGSSGLVKDWLWDFGDGGTSREQSPRHVYAANGAYGVTLQVFGFSASHTARRAAYVTVGPGGSFVRGDSNGDGRIDISDAVAILAYLYLGTFSLDCLDAADADDRGSVELSDAVRILSSLFLDGPAPEPPSPGRGVDPSTDGLGCEGG
jgi:PKD repeat protein